MCPEPSWKLKICTHTHTALCLTLFVILLRLAGLSIRVRCWCLLPQRTASGLHNLFVVVRRHSLVDTARQCVCVGGGGRGRGRYSNKQRSDKCQISPSTDYTAPVVCNTLCYFCTNTVPWNFNKTSSQQIWYSQLKLSIHTNDFVASLDPLQCQCVF